MMRSLTLAFTFSLSLQRASAQSEPVTLDQASLTSQKKKKYVTCHTNMAYMMARPALGDALKDSGEVRGFFENYRSNRWKDKNLISNTGSAYVILARQACGKLPGSSLGK